MITRDTDSPSDDWRVPSKYFRIRRVAVIALDVPPAVAAGAAEDIGYEVVLTVSLSQASALRSVRRRIKRGEVDQILAYTSDWSRQSYPSLFEIALIATTAGRPWLLANGASRSVSRRGRLHAAASMLSLAGGVGYALSQVIARRREGAAMGAAFSPSNVDLAAVPNSKCSTWVVMVWPGSPAAVGGAVTHLEGILNGFKTLGHRIALVSSYPLPPGIGRHVDQFVLTGPLGATRRLTRDTSRLAVDRQLADACRKLVVRLHPKAIYQRHAYQCVAGVKVAEETGVPLILEWNSSELWAKRNWWSSDPIPYLSSQFERVAAVREVRAVRSAAVVAAVSRGAAQMAVEAGGSIERVITVPNGVDLAAIPPPGFVPERAGGALLGWVGTFGPWHGAEVAVRGLARLPDSIHLLMIGDGVSRGDCERLAADLGVEARVEFTGSLSRPQVITRLQNCDVLLSPHVPTANTPFFGSPTKVFEYMAIGRPIVASRLEQIAEILSDDRTARLVTPGDEAALANGVLDVLALPDRGADMGRAAREDALSHHTWRARVGQILEALAHDST